MSKLIAQSEGALPELELIGKDQKQIEDAGSHPWSVENGILSTMFLFNHSSQPQYFNVRIAEDGVLWLKTYKLASMETRALSINDLISLQQKDETGNVLPKDLKKGEASWLSPATTEVSGRILQSDRLQPLARNFSCGSCNYLCGSPGLSPNSALSLDLGNQGLLGDITPDWCSLSCSYYASCPAVNNPVHYNNGGVQYSWSGGGSVASVISGWQSSTSTWQGNAAG